MTETGLRFGIRFLGRGLVFSKTGVWKMAKEGFFGLKVWKHEGLSALGDFLVLLFDPPCSSLNLFFI